MKIKYSTIGPSGILGALSVIICKGNYNITVRADELRGAHVYELRWSCATSAGGGQTLTGGAYYATGTTGQPASGGMTGGNFDSRGGFQGGMSIACTCPADLTKDGLIDARDIRRFVECVMVPGLGCACADVDASSAVDTTDVATFVASLLNPSPCPR